MGSLQKVLLPGEEVVYRAQPSVLPLYFDGAVLVLGLAMAVAGLVFLAMPWVGFGLLGLGAIVVLVGFGRLTRTMVHRGTTDMVVTNKRVLARSGVLRKESDEMFLGKIESVEVKQSLWGRLAGCGDVEVNGSGEGELFFVNIQSPGDFRRACMAAVEQALRSGSGGSGGRAEDGHNAIGEPGVVFEVQVQDRPGAEARWIEVRAENAERARAMAQAAGVKAGEARLKRIG